MMSPTVVDAGGRVYHVASPLIALVAEVPVSTSCGSHLSEDVTRLLEREADC